MIEKAIRQVVFNYTSLRGAAKNLRLFLADSKTPAHTTIYNWIMKLGVGGYLGRGANVRYHTFIIDATIEHGKEKLVLLLGVRNSVVKKGVARLSHDDVDILQMRVAGTVNSEVILDILEKAVARHGTPSQIISDGGGDMVKGINYFQRKHSRVVRTYDITHKCAIELKHVLKKDSSWQAFYSECGACRAKTVHTDLFCYAPPKGRDKSRHLNIEAYIPWLEKILYVSRLKENRLSEEFQAAFGWVEKYQKPLKRWKETISIIAIIKQEVKANGFHGKTGSVLKRKISDTTGKMGRAAKKIYDTLMEYVRETTAIIPKKEIWLGCSDIIESIFGRIKRYAKNAPFKEIPRMIMAIPIFTGQITQNKIKKTFEARTVKQTQKWLKNNIGKTYIQKRVNAFRIRRICHS